MAKKKPFVLDFVDLDSPTILLDSSKTVVYSLDIHKFISFLNSREFGGLVFVTKEGYLYAFSDDNLAFVYTGDELVEWRKGNEQKGVVKSKRS